MDKLSGIELVRRLTGVFNKMFLDPNSPAGFTRGVSPMDVASIYAKTLMTMRGEILASPVKTFVAHYASSYTTFQLGPNGEIPLIAKAGSGEPVADLGLYVRIIGTNGIATSKYTRVSNDPDFEVSRFGLIRPIAVDSGNQEHQIFAHNGDPLWETVSKMSPFCLDVEDFKKRLQALVDERTPIAEKLVQKHKDRLAKSRERAVRPDQVAKKVNAARLKARESLSKLLGKGCNRVLDDWTPEQFLMYLRICKAHPNELKKLMRWAAQSPMGSDAVDLEDVTTAINLAKVRSVQDA